MMFRSYPATTSTLFPFAPWSGNFQFGHILLTLCPVVRIVVYSSDISVKVVYLGNTVESLDV